MFRNIILTFRDIRRSGVYSIINIIGLAVSLATCVFIVLWVQDEKSYDRFHKDPENIYMAVTRFANNSGGSDSPSSTGGFATTAKELFGSVEDYCRVLQSKMNSLEYEGNQSEEVNFCYADSSFFKFFNFPIVSGNKETPLQRPADVVISEHLATVLFGREDPVGKSIKVGNGIINVTAVMKNMPKNTFLPQVDLVHSIDMIPKEFLNNWLANSFFSFLRVVPGTNVDLIAEKVTEQLPEERDRKSVV